MRAQPGFAPNVTRLGDGPRKALALHCTMAFGGAWTGFSKAMPELTLIAPDLPSHGRSPDWDEQSDFADTVYQMCLDLLAQEGPIDVIGHSFGAVVALRVAVEHPELVRSLCVIEPVFFAVALQDAPEMMSAHREGAKPFLDALAKGDRETAARLFNRDWGGEAPSWDSYPERTRQAMTRAIHVVPDTQAFLHEDTASLLRPDGVAACEVPAIAMRGEKADDPMRATISGLAARLPRGEEVIITGAGHMAPISHPAPVAEAVRGLLARS